MQPKSIPPGLKAADDKRRRVIRRIQPVAQAGDESQQACTVARFQTMKLSLVVSGYTIRDDPGGRAQFDSEIDDLMANIRRHASAPVPDVGAFQSRRGPCCIASETRFRPASSRTTLRDELSARRRPRGAGHGISIPSSKRAWAERMVTISSAAV